MSLIRLKDICRRTAIGLPREWRNGPGTPWRGGHHVGGDHGDAEPLFHRYERSLVARHDGHLGAVIHQGLDEPEAQMLGPRLRFFLTSRILETEPYRSKGLSSIVRPEPDSAKKFFTGSPTRSA